MGMPWATGGLLGVTIFFVLSGYLITSLLVIEFQGTGRINLPDFWLRRIRRLFPAIVFSVVTIAVLCTIFNHALLTKLRPDVIPSLLFFNNWWQIFHNVSYFDALGSPSPVTHFWSLAIEEQFYLIWPVLLFIMMKLGVKKRVLSIMTLVLALLSAIDMAVLFATTAPTRARSRCSSAPGLRSSGLPTSSAPPTASASAPTRAVRSTAWASSPSSGWF